MSSGNDPQTFSSEGLAEHDYELLDASGLKCPEPVMLLHKVVKRLDGNSLIKVLATDSSTERDVPRFCEFLQHDLLAALAPEGNELHYIYWIRTKEKGDGSA